jgi:hypothetical protein
MKQTIEAARITAPSEGYAALEQVLAKLGG